MEYFFKYFHFKVQNLFPTYFAKVQVNPALAVTKKKKKKIIAREKQAKCKSARATKGRA